MDTMRCVRHMRDFDVSKGCPDCNAFDARPIDAPSRYVEKLEQGKDIQGYGTGLAVPPVDHEIEDEPLDIEIQDDPSLEDHTPEMQAPYDAVKNPPHYAQYTIQPIEFIIKNNIGYCVGNVIKYVCRYNLKDGLQDLKKAREYIDIMIKAAEDKR